MRAPGWTTSEREITRIALLEWISEHSGHQFTDFLDEPHPFDVDRETLRTLVRELDYGAFVQVDSRLSGASGTIRPDGQQEVEQRRERRGSAALRNPACREALLDWLYEQKHTGGNPADFRGFAAPDPRAFFEGDPFTADEVTRAVDYLEKRGLVAGFRSLGGDLSRPSIKEDGEDVVERHGGSLSDYYRERQPATHSNTAFIYGDARGIVSVGDHNQVTQNIADPAMLLAVIGELLSSVQGVDTPDAQSLRQAILVVQEEVQSDQPDPGLLEGMVRHIKRIGGHAESAIVGSAAVGFLPHLIGFLEALRR